MNIIGDHFRQQKIRYVDRKITDPDLDLLHPDRPNAYVVLPVEFKHIVNRLPAAVRLDPPAKLPIALDRGRIRKRISIVESFLDEVTLFILLRAFEFEIGIKANTNGIVLPINVVCRIGKDPLHRVHLVALPIGACIESAKPISRYIGQVIQLDGGRPVSIFTCIEIAVLRFYKSFIGKRTHDRHSKGKRLIQSFDRHIARNSRLGGIPTDELIAFFLRYLREGKSIPIVQDLASEHGIAVRIGDGVLSFFPDCCQSLVGKHSQKIFRALIPNPRLVRKISDILL